MSEYNDVELLAAFREGREEYAFTLIVKKYQQKLYYHIRRMVKNHDDADDVLQNTLVKVWAGLKNFREEANLYTWLYRIATNETLTFLGKNKNVQLVPVDKNPNARATHRDGDANVVSTDDIYKKLEMAIATLPEKQRIVFNMKYFDEMPYENMSQVLDTSVGALKASFHHAVKKIEEFLTGN
ncbi:MAG TPA: sigma-70 family RNA polymerase sigma factor [Flavobacteriales bacterium]|nr:sigma-70 family RNA polymerase sigma factor [Flavobacteriales bacterium]